MAERPTKRISIEKRRIHTQLIEDFKSCLATSYALITKCSCARKE